jgi:hypothetical protein
MKLEFFRQIFERCSNVKFNENPFTGSRVPFGQTIMIYSLLYYVIYIVYATVISYMYTSLHVKYQLFLSDFNQD